MSPAGSGRIPSQWIKRPWTAEQDEALRQAVAKHGAKNWSGVAEMCEPRLKPALDRAAQHCADPGVRLLRIPDKNGKQCRWVAQAFCAGQVCTADLGVFAAGRERWINHIDPAINRSPWTHEDDVKLIEAHGRLGNKWTDLAALFPGRTDNMIKNRWNSTIQKKLRDQLAKQAAEAAQAVEGGAG